MEPRNARETPADPPRYRVLRSFGSVGGKPTTPGDIIEADAAWPYHRARDLTTQRYLEPLAPAPRRGKE